MAKRGPDRLEEALAKGASKDTSIPRIFSALGSEAESPDPPIIAPTVGKGALPKRAHIGDLVLLELRAVATLFRMKPFQVKRFLLSHDVPLLKIGKRLWVNEKTLEKALSLLSDLGAQGIGVEYERQLPQEESEEDRRYKKKRREYW